MSLYDYEISKQLSKDDPPFAAIIMAALRKADSNNFMLLEAAWPEITAEMKARYNAPEGRLEGDPPPPEPEERRVREGDRRQREIIVSHEKRIQYPNGRRQG